jgi:hypothetical protein
LGLTYKFDKGYYIDVSKKINLLANRFEKSPLYPPFDKGGEGGFIKPEEFTLGEIIQQG